MFELQTNDKMICIADESFAWYLERSIAVHALHTLKWFFLISKIIGFIINYLVFKVFVVQYGKIFDFDLHVDVKEFFGPRVEIL